LASRFLDDIKTGISEATYQTYRSKIRIFYFWTVKEKLSENDISTINNIVIRAFFNYLINTKKLSGNSIHKYENILTALFEWVKKEKYIFLNPVYNIPACNRINDNAPRPIQRQDIETFKKEIRKDPELWLAVQLEYYCALRPGHELREMKVKDIDFIGGTIRVSRTHAKNRIERFVTMPHQLLLEMRNIYKLQNSNKEHFVFGKGGKPGPSVIGKNKLRYKFNRVREHLNMPHEYKFYSWKHTGAVEADECSIPMKDISRHLGHTSLKSTDAYFKNKKTGTSKAIRDNFPDL